MSETSIGVSADTKHLIDEAKPDSHTHDEFIRALLDDGVETKTYVDAEAVTEELGLDTADVQEAARKGAADAIKSLQ